MNRLFYNKVFVIFFMLLLTIITIGCKKTTPSLSFSKTDWEVTEGDSFTLTPTVTDLKGENLVNYAFDTSGIVSLTTGNTFAAVSAGVVHITASLKGHPQISVVITVTVAAKNVVVKVASIALNGATSVEIGSTTTLGLTVLPENANNKTVTWTSSDVSIATVNNGVVNALSAGDVVITATAADGSNISGTLNIKVIALIITGTITLASDKAEGYVGDQISLVPTVETNATDKSLIWSVDSTKASVNNGVVSLTTAGTVVVTARLKTNEAISGTFTITIYDKIASLGLVASKKYLPVGTIETLIVNVTPTNAKKNITWASSDDTIISVTNGTITCLKEGLATITATAADGSAVSGNLEIRVISANLDTSTTLADPNVATLNQGDEITFGGIKFYVGINAFATLTEAINNATTKTYVASGTYSDNIMLAKNNFQLLGPNADINPLSGVRLNEAIITGKITIAKGLKNILIKGFAFTQKGMVDSMGNVEGVEVSYNNVYDTNTDVAAWVDARTEVEAVFDFWAIAGEEIKDITIKYNKFVNVKETNVMVARNINVNVSHNGFYNFGMDAIRGDGGYNYGLWAFEHNEFINDVQGANNGIYLQSISGLQGDVMHTILISNNIFKNIGLSGATSSYNSAISMRTYQEQGLKLDILYNTFEKCVNYLNIRNNGATAATFTSNVNYNKFIGIPSGVYHRNIRPDSTDTASSNPPLTNMDYNYFEDNDNLPITDLSVYEAKFLDLSSYAYNFATKAEYESIIKALNGVDYTMVVNLAWDGLTANTKVEMSGFTWTIGLDAFVTIQGALDAAQPGEVIKVAAGIYGATLTINKNDITLLGANSGVNPVMENRQNESQLTTQITVETGISGFTLDGFELTLAARIVLKNNTTKTTLKNAVLSATSADGIIRGPELGSEMTSNVVMNNNYSPAFSSYRFAWFQNVDGIEMVGNSLTCTSAYDFLNIGGYIKGKVVINDNTYINSMQSFLYIKGVGVLDATIEGNYVERVANTIIDFRDMQENGAVVFNIRYNTFVAAGQGWCPIRIRTANYDSNDSISINVEFNYFIDSYYAGDEYNFVENPSLSTAPEGFKKIYTIGRNYYEINNVALTSLTDGHFSNAAISFADPYTSKDDVPAYEKEDTVKPTAIQITNKVTQIDAFLNHQILFKITPSETTNKKVAFRSSDTSVATVSSAGLVSAKGSGTCTITIYSIVDETIFDSFIFTVIPVERIEARYDGNAVLRVGDTLEIETNYFGPDSTPVMAFTSSNPSVATVDNSGVVTALSPGVVLITVKYGSIEAIIGFTVVSASTPLSDILQLFVDANNGVVNHQTIVYIGSDDGTADFPHDIYSAASDYWVANLPSVTRNMLSTTAENFDGRQMQSIEFIVVHDTAGSPSTSTAYANSHWCTNTTNTGSSWQYTIGNDGIYQQVEDNMVAWHAGDGASWADTTTLYDTGIAYEGERPKVTVGIDGYFYINGKKSLVEAPAGSTLISTLGLVCFKGANGNYIIPTTHVTASGAIAARGGNLNGIGIETAVNLGSDVYLTWQLTAKHIATLLVKHNLTPDRVWFHNSFSNKNCPRTMTTAGRVNDFLEMVYMEYNILKNYSDYTITFTSSNPSILDNSGRVVNAPNYTTNVTYTVTVTKGSLTESIVLNALVVGKYN